MRALLLLALIFFTGFSIQAQQGLLDQTVTFEKGVYSSGELIERIIGSGISINYATASLQQFDVELNGNPITLVELLSKLFPPSGFSIVEKEGRILIIPLNRSSITISGYVEDLSSKERLIGANVYLPELGLGTATNTYGFYSLTINSSPDTLRLWASSIGYGDQAYKMVGNRNYKLDIGLESESEQLQEITVTDEDKKLGSTQMSQIKLNAAELKSIPKFFGEEDVLKAIQLLPGVQSANEGSIYYIVRGGGPDQNLILLDGVPVYNASHLFGFFSVFNPDAIKNVQFTKGGFPARYGGRLSSVLEIDMKEGDMKKYHGSGSLGFLASELTLEGPIVKDKASFMISGRRTYFDLLYRPFLEDEDGGYFFADINAKLNYKFSRKDRLYLSFYRGRDKLFSDFRDDVQETNSKMDYGNMTGALRWNHLFNQKVFSNLTATYTRYNLSLRDATISQVSSEATEYFSRMEDVGLRYDFDHALAKQHYLKYGLSYTYHTFRPGALQFNTSGSLDQIDSLLALSPANYAHDSYLYIEDDWTINSRWRLNTGLHYSAYFVEESFYHSLQPRVAARYMIKPKWSVKASYSYMQQYVHLLTNSRIGLPTDLWVSSTDRIRPQKSNQWALGSANKFWGDRLELNVELYYKYMTGLIAFKEDVLFKTGNDWQDQVTTGGTGDAYGCEFLLRKSKGKTTGWISYTLSKSTRQFSDINDGERFPYKYDRRHDLKLFIDHKFSERFSMAAAFVLNSGLRATIPSATFTDIFGFQSVLYSDRNAYTYPTYHRMDISFNWIKPRKWGETQWTVGLYNAYNNQNPYFIYFQRQSSGGIARQVSIFPILPSVGYSFKF